MGTRRITGTVAVTALVGLLGIGSAAAQTITDPTGSVSIGTDGSPANGSVLAYSNKGCVRSGLVAVRTELLLPGDTDRWCPSSNDSEAPIVIDPDGRSYGTVLVGGGYGGRCWNPVGTGCLPSVVLAHSADGEGGNVVFTTYDGRAYDYGAVPGVMYTYGSGNDHTVGGSHAYASIVVALDGYAHGRILAVSGGDGDADTNGPQGVAVVAQDGNASSNGPGGVAVAGEGDATTNSGLVAVAPQGNASGALVNIDNQ